ncbi:MAG: hypothetical protein CSB24_04395 [Deltaproteobacteria bacterium]|nr:MAG: hypothetical protein CSB24_04395 [Deltaproteobacteria bacterium]
MNRLVYFLYRRWFSCRKRLARRLTSGGKVFLAMTFAACFFGLNPERSMFFQLFPLLIIIMLTDFLFSLGRKPRLKIRRKLPETCIAGQQLSYPLAITNLDQQKSAWIFISERQEQQAVSGDDFFSISTGSLVSRIKQWRHLFDKKPANHPVHRLPEIRAGASLEFTANLRPLRRGSLHFQGLKVFSACPFGLFKREINYPQQANLLVLPRLYPAPKLQFTGSRKYHQGGLSTAGKSGDSEEFISLREYAPGDPLKKIDWKATAKAGDTIVRQFRDEYFSRFGLLLDTFCPKDKAMIFEEAVCVAASLLAAHNPGENLLDTLFAGDKKCCVPTLDQGRADQLQMMKILASVQPCLADNFDNVTSMVREHLKLLSGLVVVLVSIDQDRAKFINFIAAAKIPYRIILICEDKEAEQARLKSLAVTARVALLEMDNIASDLITI